MESACIRHTELPHTTRLFADFVYHFDRVAPFYRHAPGDFQHAAAEIQFSPERRAALVSALRTHNEGKSALALLAKEGTVAVVTGQQVGLFSGPAYTIYKALTAVRLARQLTESGIPAVPVFWLATEDHDFAEISRAWSFDPANQPVAFDTVATTGIGGPVGEILIGDPPLDKLRTSLDGFPFGGEIADLVGQTYNSGTLGSAFRLLLERLLGDYGLLFLDPMQPAIRDLAAPLFRKALEQGPELNTELLSRNQQLTDAGYHAQVHVEASTSLFFLLENGKRVPLKRHGGDYLAGARRISMQEMIDRGPSISPNALLRPVIQDALLPTVAYIGGPAELAYLAQSEVIYRALLGRMPVAVPRTGFTLFDARAAKLMDRYGLQLPDFFHGPEVLRDRLARLLVPPSVSGAMTQAQSATARAIDGLSAELRAFDPTLDAALATSRHKMEFQLAKLDRKIRREALLRDERASREAAYLHGLIYPAEHLQERLYSILPFLARHGLDLIGTLYGNIRLDCPDHRLLVV